MARRVVEDNDDTTYRLSWHYAEALQRNGAATLDDVREAVQTLEETAPVARRVLGGEHPVVQVLERSLLKSRVALTIHETQPPGTLPGSV